MCALTTYHSAPAFPFSVIPFPRRSFALPGVP